MRPLTLALLLSVSWAAVAQERPYDRWPEADPLSPPAREEPPSPPAPTRGNEDAPTQAPQPASAPPGFMNRVEFGYRAWWLGHVETANVRERGGNVSKTQTDQDLDLGHTFLHTANVRVRLFKWLELRGEYLHGSLTGTRSLSSTESVIYNGETFSDETIDSRLTIQVATVEVNPGWEWSWVKIGGLVGVRWISTRLGIRSCDDGDHTAERDSFWATSLGFEARFRSNGEPDVGGFVRLRGNASYWDNEATGFFDGEAGITVTFAEHLRLTGGYRFLFGYLHEHGKRDRKSAFAVGGPWVGLTLRF